MQTQTQKQKIRAHLKRHGSITGLEALNLYGCFRLAARIQELRREGVIICTKPYVTPGGARIAKYELGGLGA